MASFRRIPSGKWQATVLLPDGRRTTRSAPLKGSVKAWADEEERKIRRGEWIDPKVARLTVGGWLDLWTAARVVQSETARADQYSDRRVRAALAGRPLGAVTRLEVQGWVKRMIADGVGAPSIRRTYIYLATAYNAAVAEGVVAGSPCRRITLPNHPEKIPEWFTPEEVDRLVGALAEPHATMTLAMCWLGLRWGECAGLRVQDVDWLRRRVQVVGAVTQNGAWKEHPKTKASRRELPAPPWLIERMSVGAPTEGQIWRNRAGRPFHAEAWRRTFARAVKAAGVPEYTPHACRHTAASWLVQNGATLYQVQMFLGHEDPATTQIYAFLAPDANGRIEAIWKVIAHRPRTGEEKAR